MNLKYTINRNLNGELHIVIYRKNGNSISLSPEETWKIHKSLSAMYPIELPSSTELIRGAKQKYENLRGKRYDWVSFYNGFLEAYGFFIGRVK